MHILNYAFDIAFVVIAVVTMWIVARRMMIESGLLFLAILLSSLVSMSLFEPIAELCRQYMFSLTDIAISKYLWFFLALAFFAFSFGGLFQLFFSAFERVPQFNRTTELIGCWGFGALAGYTLAAFLLTIVHTIPGPRDFWGLFEPDARLRPGPVMAFAPDYQFIWLADCVCSERGCLPVGSTAPQEQSPSPKVQAALAKARLAWFPIRYANWREKLEIYDLERADDLGYTDEPKEDPPAISSE